MQKIILSNSDLTFNHITQSANQYPEYISIVFESGDHTFEEIEEAFTGNDLIQIVDHDLDASIMNLINYRDYTVVRGIHKDNGYVVGEDEEFNLIKESVYIVDLEKEDITTKIKNLEEAVQNLIITALD